MFVRTFSIIISILVSLVFSQAQASCLVKNNQSYDYASDSLLVAQQYLTSRPGRAIDQALSSASIGDDLRKLLHQRDKLRLASNNQNPNSTDALKNLEKIKNIEQQIEEISPNLLSRLTFNPLTVDELQNELRNDEALIILLETDKDSFAWWIDKDCFRWERLSDFSKTNSNVLIAQLREGISPTSDIRGNNKGSKIRKKDKPFPKNTAKIIHDKILGSFSDRLAGKKSINIHANGNFLSIPFAALIDPKTDRFEIENRSYGFLPSLSALSRSDNLITLSDRDSILAIGAPKQINNPALQWLSALPGAEAELRQIKDRYPQRAIVLSGASASKEQFQNSIKSTKPELLLFSTHAILDDSLGIGNHGLLMASDDVSKASLMTSDDISAYNLNSNLVILSACNTWAGDKGQGDALTTLALSFFQAGSKNLIVTHWPISDASAASWSQYMIDNLISTNLATPETLRQSQLALMKSEGGRFAHPRHWAPYIFIAGGQ